MSIWGGNWAQTVEIEEKVEQGESVEIVSTDAVFTHVVENMVGWRKRLDQYLTTLTHCLQAPGNSRQQFCVRLPPTQGRSAQ